MFRNDGTDLAKRPVNCLLTDGGLGDHVASLVAVDYIVKTSPHVNLLLWTPDYLVDFAKHLLPHLVVRNFTTARTKFDGSKPTIHTRWDGRVSPMKMHLLDYAFHVLCDKHVSLQEKNYLQIRPDEINIDKLNIPKKFLVMTTGFTAPNREFYAEHVNKVVNYVKSQNYDIVFLGKKVTQTGARHIIKGNFSEDIDLSKGLDLIDKTSLLEASKIMHESSGVIGLDNGLLHIAGCTQVPIIGGFTNVNPIARMPVRNDVLGWNYYPVVPPESLACRFCQSNLSFVYDFDFKNCFYKDYACLKQLSAELYIEQLEKVLK